MPLIGITPETLLTLLGVAFVIPTFISIFLWKFIVPPNAKEIFYAKILKKDINISVSSTGKLRMKRGRAEGPGVFRYNNKENVSFIPQGQEPWISKMFHGVGDRIGYLLSYGGKAVCTNFETQAVLAMHQNLMTELHELKTAWEKLGKKGEEPTLKDAFQGYWKKYPKARKLLQQLKDAKMNVRLIKDKVQMEESREVAILMDPPVLQEYITKTLHPSQLFHANQVAYERGVNDTANPASKHKLLIIALLIVVVVVAVVAMLFLSGGGQAVPKAPVVTATPRPSAFPWWS